MLQFGYMRCCGSILALLAALGAASSMLAADGARSFSWHVAEVQFKAFGPRLDFVLHTRTRTSDNFGRLDQLRTGAVVRFNASPSWAVYSGYYFQPQHAADDLWVRGHRVFSGIENASAPHRDLRLITRLSLERFLGTGRPDYNRYRSYARLQIGRRQLIPFVQNETIAVKQGFHSTRSGGGVRWRISPEIWVEGGALYDVRRFSWGGDRIAIVTSVKYEPRGRQ